MTEAKNNPNSLQSLTEQQALENHEKQGKKLEEVIATANNDSSNNLSTSVSLNESAGDIADSKTEKKINSKMNWQQVAHKLREYNRKLLKKVFRLEQELAEIDNKFNKYLEKSRNSDLLVAQQEAEIQKYQEQIAVFSQQLATSQATIDQKDNSIQQLHQECQAAQQQSAQLERECTLLQEKYQHQAYELSAKEQNNQELQTKLSQQKRSTLQYQAELKRYRDREALSNHKSLPEIPVKPEHRQYASRRTIQPWSTPNSEPKITLPKTKASTRASQPTQPSETVKTAAEIATWSVSQPTPPQATPEKSPERLVKTVKTTNSPSSARKKPQSLAAVDLPTFPRPL